MNTKRLRNARKSFRTRFGADRFNVVELLSRGLASGIVATRLGITPGSVAAIKANLTRGTYSPLVKVVNGKVIGTCFRR